MIEINSSIAFAGSLASLITLFVAAPSWKSRLVHALYVLVVTVVASAYVETSSQLSKYTEMEIQANHILNSADFSSEGSIRGFIFASLSFLEKNKSKLPETYQNAKLLAENSGLLISDQDNGVNRLHQEWRLKDVGEAMRGLLRGLAAPPND